MNLTNMFGDFMKKETNISKDKGHSFEDYFKRAVNPFLVLLLLSERPMYVYEMANELEKRSEGKYCLSLLYPVIYRLVSQGFVIEGEKLISNDNRVRQYYKITSEGLDYLNKIEVIYERMTETIKKICEVSGGNRQ